MCGGGKGTQTTSQQMAAPNPAAMAAYNQAMGSVNKATSTPFQRYSNDPTAYVSPLTQTQTGAISNISGMAGMTDPYYQAATGLTAAGAGPVGRLTGEQIGEYMNPYMSQVVDPVTAAMEQQFGRQLSQQQTQAIKAGAFGGERAALERALLRGQQGLALGSALSPLYQTGYGQALGTAQGQQAIEAQNQQRMLAAGQQFGGLGTAAQGAALQQAGAQLQAGTLEQQTRNAMLQALYGEAQKERMYPLQAAQIQAQAAGAIGPLMGSYQQTMQPQPFFGGIFADGGSVGGYGEGLGRARMGGAVHEGGDYARGGYADGGYSGDISGLVEQHRAALGLGMPKEDIQVPMMQMTPGRAPEISAPPARREPGLVSKAISGYAEDPERLGKAYESGKEALGKAKDIFGFLSGSSSPLPSSFSGYADGGGVDSEDAAMQQLTSTPIQTSNPLKPQDAPERQKSGLGSLLKAGASMAANYFLPGSGMAVNAGLGALGMAHGGRAGYEDGGDIFERGILGAESGRRQFDREGRVLTSPKGALGIAQIMPTTAPEAAKLAGLPYDEGRLRTDADYNKRLGQAYYNEQLRRFGSPELAAAAYNAGPGAVQKALRRAEATGRDVMSFLPAETRDYVPRVMRMGGEGGIGAAREGIASVRREIPPGDPRRSMVAMYPERPTTEAAGPSAGLGSAQVKDEGFLERTEKHPESLILPVLKGLGAMAGSRSRYLGSAILEGLGAGAGSYMDMAAKQAEIDKMKQTTASEAEVTRKIGEETGLVGAQTLRELLAAKKSGINQYGPADSPYYTVTLEDGTEMLLEKWMELPNPPNLIGGQAAADIARRLATGRTAGVPAAAPAAAAPSPAETAVETAKDVTKAPAAAPGQTPASGAPAKQQPLTTPVEPPKLTPGVVYDDESREAARQDAKLRFASPQQQQMATVVQKTYAPKVVLDAQSARDNTPYLNELSETLAKAYKGEGAATPGYGAAVRAQALKAADTFYRALGGEGSLSGLPEAADITGKITSLLSRESAAGAGQESYAALNAIKEAIPNLEMDPHAGAKLAAELMVLRKRSLDREEHMKAWTRDSKGILYNAPKNFTEKNPDAKYQVAQKVIADMILHHPDAFERIMSGTMPRESIERQIRAPKEKGGYGAGVPEGISEFFPSLETARRKTP